MKSFGKIRQGATEKFQGTHDPYTSCLKKTVQLIFCQNFVKFRPICENFWLKDNKEDKLFWGTLIFHLT